MDHLYSGEMLFLNATWSGTQGAKLILALPSREDLAAFDCVRRGSRLACVLVPINDDETPGKVDKPLSVQAALLCKQVSFWEYVEARAGYSFDEPAEREAQATTWLKTALRIESRAELDTNTNAAVRFSMLREQLRAANLDKAYG
jgi:hypothetical protein